MKPANFSIVREDPDGAWIVLTDQGPWDAHLTITNDAERVVTLFPRCKRIFYYDSIDGEQTELLMDSAHQFCGFRDWDGETP